MRNPFEVPRIDHPPTGTPAANGRRHPGRPSHGVADGQDADEDQREPEADGPVPVATEVLHLVGRVRRDGREGSRHRVRLLGVWTCCGRESFRDKATSTPEFARGTAPPIAPCVVRVPATGCRGRSLTQSVLMDVTSAGSIPLRLRRSSLFRSPPSFFTHWEVTAGCESHQSLMKCD